MVSVYHPPDEIFNAQNTFNVNYKFYYVNRFDSCFEVNYIQFLFFQVCSPQIQKVKGIETNKVYVSQIPIHEQSNLEVQREAGRASSDQT